MIKKKEEQSCNRTRHPIICSAEDINHNSLMTCKERSDMEGQVNQTKRNEENLSPDKKGVECEKENNEKNHKAS